LTDTIDVLNSLCQEEFLEKKTGIMASEAHPVGRLGQ